MERKTTGVWHIIKYDGNSAGGVEAQVAAEFPLTIRLDGDEFATIVCTPAELEDLTVGFLASEGVIRSVADIESLDIQAEKGFAYVSLRRKQSTGKDYYAKRFIGSCCGKSRQFYFHNDARTAKTITSKSRIAAGQCLLLMELLQEDSGDFHNTGGVHNAALCGPTGILAVRSDIGRHNALDKLFGHCLRNRLAVSDKIIAFSGRMSSEVVLKTAKIGCGILLSKSAPTDLALRLADDLGITCAGFIRGREMNVYTHHDRIDFNIR